MNRLLEEEAVDEILSFASDFPSQEDQAVDLLLDFMTDPALVVDMDLVHWAVNHLRAIDAIACSQQNGYLESDILETREIIIDLTDLSFPFQASISAIQALPDVFTTDGFSSSWVCAVCLDDQIDAKDGAKQLPCKHIFHTHCIIPWLELHNSCPLCRYQLPT